MKGLPTTLDECDAAIRQSMANIASMRDQIAAHDLAVQMKEKPQDVHWLNRVRKARRMREAELAELRALRPKLKPVRPLDLRDFIIEAVRCDYSDEEWRDVMNEAREAAHTIDPSGLSTSGLAPVSDQPDTTP